MGTVDTAEVCGIPYDQCYIFYLFGGDYPSEIHYRVASNDPDVDADLAATEEHVGGLGSAVELYA